MPRKISPPVHATDLAELCAEATKCGEGNRQAVPKS